MRIRRFIGGVLLTLALGTAVAGVWMWKAARAAAITPGAATEVRELEIGSGTSLRAVLRDLERLELVPKARHLEWYLRCCRAGKALAAAGVKAGRYRIAPGQAPVTILRQLVEGRVVLEHITIVEGWTFAQMRAALFRKSGLQRTVRDMSDAEIMRALGAPELPAEGQFAPDTYAFSPGTTTDMQILRLSFDAQQRNLQEAWESRQPDLPLSTPAEALTLASIVEKETGLARERNRVAGVFVNRLRRGMRLQSDPTVIYGLGARYDGNIRRRDLTTDNPYNTYTRTGLPPTAIALPGREAIIATLNPERTDAIFFVAIGDGSGGHYFSATLEQHNRAVQRYLERLRAEPPLESAQPGGAAP